MFSTKHTALSTKERPAIRFLLSAYCLVLTAIAGCATPQYAIRQTPVPEESASARQIEQAISAVQAREFDAQGSRLIGEDERLVGLAIQPLVDRLSRVTERPALRYRAYLVQDHDPNAAALADGRVYLTTGMLNYLAHRRRRVNEPFGSSLDKPGTRSGRMPSVPRLTFVRSGLYRAESRYEVEAELAFVLSHELAHTVAQHLVKRYRLLQQQQLLIALVAAGASAATQNAGAGAQQAGRLVLDAASLLQDVHNSGYSQEQELEADQLGIRYVIRAGFDPQAALDLLDDFSQFENPWPFLRTHPYSTTRREYLRRYLAETGHLGTSGARANPLERGATFGGVEATGTTRRASDDRIRRLRDAQKLYPVGSVSWKNLQRQINAIESSP